MWAFSLVELVIAMAILGVGLIGAMRVFPIGLRASHRAELSSRATMLGQRAIESLKLQPWDQLTDGSTTAQEDPFTITTRIAPASIEHLADPSRLKTIEVTVQWQQDNHPRTLTFLTYLRRESS